MVHILLTCQCRAGCRLRSWIGEHLRGHDTSLLCCCAALFISIAVSRVAFAQSEEKDTDNEPRTWTERVRDWTDTSSPGAIRPVFVVLVPGSGVAGGVAVNAHDMFGSGIDASGEGIISIYNYRQMAIRGGVLARRHELPELRAWDAMQVSLMSGSSNREAKGFTLYGEYRHQSLPGLSLYGRGEPGMLRADFERSATTLDVVAQVKPTAGLGFGFRSGLVSMTLGSGGDERRTDAAVAFSRFNVPAYGHSTWIVSGVGTQWDARNDAQRPTQGVLLQGGAWWFANSSSLASEPSFGRVALDLRSYAPVGGPAHVLAMRLLVSADGAGSGTSTPFFLQQTLGGSHSLRGYSNYRVRAERLAAISIESRWQVQPWLDVVPLFDVGFASRSPVDLGYASPWTDVGIGGHFRVNDRVVARTEVGFGREGTHWVLTLSPSF